MKIRIAKKEDIKLIVELLAQDDLGMSRENFMDPLPDSYIIAFENIRNDPNQILIVGEKSAGEIVATLQLSFIQYLTYEGGIRAQIEAVRVKKDFRGAGIGRSLLQWAIEKAKAHGAHLVQLTTDKKRPQAFEFYRRLGFVSTHEGMKLHF